MADVGRFSQLLRLLSTLRHPHSAQFQQTPTLTLDRREGHYWCVFVIHAVVYDLLSNA